MCSITPSIEKLLEMKAKGAARYVGVEDPLMFRCIAVSDGTEKAVLCGYDLISAPFCGKLTEILEEKYGIKPENCVFSATHNHEALNIALPEGEDYSIMEKYMLRPSAPTEEAKSAVYEYSEWVLNKVVETIGEAIEKMKPAKVGYAKGKSYINVCRDLPTPIGPIQANNFHGPSDHELLVIRFDDLEGNTIGMFLNHATHSNYMIWNLGEVPKIGVDVGGGVSRFVENANKNQFPVIWAQGAAGDQNPIVRSGWRIVEVNEKGEISMSQHIFKYDDSMLQMKCLTSTQGMEVIALSEGIDNFTDECSFAGGETFRDIPARKSYVSLGLYGDLQQINTASTESKSNVKSTLRCGDRPEPIPMGDDLKMRFRLFKLNDDISFAGVNCEAYSNLGLIIKDIVPTEATAVCTVNYSCGMGYVMDAEAQWINGFGTSQSLAWSGELANEAFTDGYTELKKKLF